MLKISGGYMFIGVRTGVTPFSHLAQTLLALWLSAPMKALRE